MFVLGDQVARHIKEINSFSEGLGFDCGVLITRMHLEKMLLPKCKDEKNHIQAIRTRRPSLSLTDLDCGIAKISGMLMWTDEESEESEESGKMMKDATIVTICYSTRTLFIRCSYDVPLTSGLQDSAHDGLLASLLVRVVTLRHTCHLSVPRLKRRLCVHPVETYWNLFQNTIPRYFALINWTNWLAVSRLASGV